MTPRRYMDVLAALRDMRDYAENTGRIALGRTREDLDDDLPYRFSILYPLQVVGEAATRIPPVIRQLAPEIPWRTIVAFRNVIVHDYDGVRMDKVQAVLDNEIAALLERLDRLIQMVEERKDDVLPDAQ